MATRTYEIEKGDTLSSIAQRMGVGIDEIAKANSISEADRRRLKIGLKLEIPEATAKEGHDYHVVKSGDSLWALAQKHSTTVAAIVSANGLPDEGRLTAGQGIYIPSSAPEANATVKKTSAPSGQSTKDAKAAEAATPPAKQEAQPAPAVKSGDYRPEGHWVPAPKAAAPAQQETPAAKAPAVQPQSAAPAPVQPQKTAPAQPVVAPAAPVAAQPQTMKPADTQVKSAETVQPAATAPAKPAVVQVSPGVNVTPEQKQAAEKTAAQVITIVTPAKREAPKPMTAEEIQAKALALCKAEKACDPDATTAAAPLKEKGFLRKGLDFVEAHSISTTAVLTGALFVASEGKIKKLPGGSVIARIAENPTVVKLTEKADVLAARTSEMVAAAKEKVASIPMVGKASELVGKGVSATTEVVSDVAKKAWELPKTVADARKMDFVLGQNKFTSTLERHVASASKTLQDTRRELAVSKLGDAAERAEKAKMELDQARAALKAKSREASALPVGEERTKLIEKEAQAVREARKARSDAQKALDTAKEDFNKSRSSVLSSRSQTPPKEGVLKEQIQQEDKLMATVENEGRAAARGEVKSGSVTGRISNKRRVELEGTPGNYGEGLLALYEKEVSGARSALADANRVAPGNRKEAAVAAMRATGVVAGGIVADAAVESGEIKIQRNLGGQKSSSLQTSADVEPKAITGANGRTMLTMPAGIVNASVQPTAAVLAKNTVDSRVVDEVQNPLSNQVSPKN